jgi:Tol biopolymer transport system component
MRAEPRPSVVMRLMWVGIASVLCFANAAACVGDPPTVPDASDAASSDATIEGDANVVDASAADATDASSSCDIHAPFTSSAIVANVNTQAAEFIPSLTPDETTIFFEAYRFGDGGTSVSPSIFTSSRASASGTFALPTSVVELNSTGQNGGPWIMPNNTTLYMISNRSGNFDIYVASRPTPTAVFAVPPPVVANINSTGNDFNASLSPDSSEIFFASSRSGPFRMYHALSSGSSFGTPMEVTELTSAIPATGGIANPALSASGLYLYFTVSQNADFSGTHAVWLAERATKNDPFGNAHAVTEVNADGPSQAGWISTDLCRLYVTQTRATGGVGASDIFMYTRSR